MADTDTLDRTTDAPESEEQERMKRSTRDEKQEEETNSEPKSSEKNEETDQSQSARSRAGNAINRARNLDPRNRLKNLDPRERLSNAKQQLKSAGKDFGKKVAKQAAQKAVVAVAAGNPVALIVIGIVILLIFIIIMIASGGGAGAGQNNKNAPKLTISKTGPEQAATGDILAYQITVTYPGTAQDIEVTDKIPEGTSFESAEPPAKYDDAVRTATWNLKDIQASPGAILSNVNTVLNIRLKATADNSFLINQAQATLVGAGIQPPGGGGGPVSGDIAKLLPNPIPPDPAGIDDTRTNTLKLTSVHRSIYEEASKITGVPWQILAGIHNREGSSAPNTSLTSGRPIGGNEPDVTDGPGCSSSTPQGIDDGEPEAFSGGCKFASMLDSGIYAGNHLKQKVNGNLNVFEDLVKALSYYNGGGNANCGAGVPYSGCPRLFIGEDDPYVLNFFDQKHIPMYVIYCGDGRKCNSLVEDERPGTATVAKWAAQSN